jgi:hypothetical protein
MRRKARVEGFTLLPHPSFLVPFKFPGGNGEGATPVPISNTEVKPFCADGTAWAAGWESRTPPGIFLKPVFNRALSMIENGLFI